MRLGLGYAGVVLLILVVMFPFLWLLQMSFKPDMLIFAWPPVLTFEPTMKHYTDLQGGQFQKSFANSGIISVTSTALSLLIGVPASYVLSRARLGSKGTIALWILATRMAPPIAFTIPFFLAYRQLEWIDTLQGMVLIYMTFNLSLVIWMMRTFFDSIPRVLEEAALIDGASVWGTFRRVILPLSAPGLGATAIFAFLFSWNDFFYALILTRTKAMTAPVAVVNFMNYEGWEWGKIAAGGTMVMLPVVMFSLVVRNYLVRGLTAGAVKG
ncbi:MAG: carbohydrate ABC transporter permease [Chloroflexi bacterium]|nr:carbohydrate ABC transporter permease [Chloroflexota bacterium]MCL5109168.1 carbohydrate ABC transporter permease [Chloroflexota bacterium]